jgi:hypothetical protein
MVFPSAREHTAVPGALRGRERDARRLAVIGRPPTAALLLGLALATAGCSKKSAAGTESSSTASMLASATGEARIVADEQGYTPSSVAVPKGPPGSKVTLTFVRTSDKTCATEVVFPELNVEKPLPLNQPVSIQVPSDAARTLNFQCGMAMFKGALVVK